MRNSFYILLAILTFASCRQKNTTDTADINHRISSTYQDIEVKYATGFDIQTTETGYIVQISNPWPDAQDAYTFKLHYKQRELLPDHDTPQSIQIPVKSIVLSSTTHITPVVLLEEQHSITGFPDTDYISDTSVRQLIDDGKIEDLGQNQTMNIERVIALQPDVVMSFGINGDNPTYDKIIKASIPVIYNGDWTEEHPLGKAEWIKLFGLLYGKEQQADSIFKQIEKSYLETQQLASQLDVPTVIAGATWKDVWYLPYGNSWQGRIITDAHGDYIYKSTTGKGSLSYNLERVLVDAQHADVWIAPGQYTSYSKMKVDNEAYQQFKAFKDKRVYTFALNKGEKGGIRYYEEASTRPDLVLKDLVKILHPQSLPDYETYFFKPLED